MKKNLIILLLILISSFSVYAENRSLSDEVHPVFHFTQIPLDSIPGRRLSDAKTLAIDFIRRSIPRMTSSQKTLGERTILSLRNPAFHAAINEIAKSYCELSGKAFFTSTGLMNTIFICPQPYELIKSASNLKLESLAQILIHEGAHLALELDECKVTKFELDTMINSNVGIKTRMSIRTYNNPNICDLSMY